jgi:hypothetical protein
MSLPGRIEDLVVDDFRTPIEGRARFGRPYLKVAAVIGFAAALLGFGYFGPHTPGSQTSPSPSVSALPTPQPTPVPTLASIATPTPREADIAGLTRFEPPAGRIAVTWLPGQVTSESMALVGAELYFIVGGSQIDSTEVGANGPFVPLVTAPSCQGINQLAAAGGKLIYVVTSPGGPSARVASCGKPGSVSWSLWMVDLQTGDRHEVAAGVRPAPTIATLEFPIHIAMSSTAYAFDRPPSTPEAAQGETVEVHRLDGSLLWTSATKRPVADVMLGGDRLAVLTQSLSTAPRVYQLSTSTSARPDLVSVDLPASSASISADGSTLVWDVAYLGHVPGQPGPSRVQLKNLDAGRESDLTTLTGNAFPEPLHPEVWSIRGRRLVTWFTTAPSGAVYPAIRDVGGSNGIFLPSVQEPIWVGIEDNTLVWVAESPDGWSGVALSVDLSALDLS